MDYIAVAGDLFWVYGFEEEGVIVLSKEWASQPRVSGLNAMGEHFLIWAMSFESTSLRGFSFTDLGRAFGPSSNATDFRFLGIFIVGSRGERETLATLGMGEWERMERPDRSDDEPVSQDVHK